RVVAELSRRIRRARARRRSTALPQTRLARRVRLRLELGRRLRARGPRLLSEARRRGAVHARDGPARAAASGRAAPLDVAATERGPRRGRGARRFVAARAVSARCRARRARAARFSDAQELPVPLAQRWLRIVR